MSKEKFNNKIRDLAELQFLSGSLESMDEFTEFYEKMLAKALVRQDQVTAAAMKKILLKQAGFLMSEYVKEKATRNDMANVQ